MPESRDFVQRFHAGEASGVFVVAGGGSLLLSDLLTVPGASRTVLEALVPYSETSMTAYLGATPEQACSSSTARALAMRAFQRATRLAPGAVEKRFGFAITASLRTAAPKRGEHRVFIAVQTLAATHELQVKLSKDLRTRDDEERLTRDLGFYALGSGLSIAVDTPTLGANETPVRIEAVAPPAWQRLWTGADTAHVQGPSSTPRVVFPGAFNPLHEGHRRIASFAAERLQRGVTFEICVTNVDKPPLDCVDLVARLSSFGASDPVWLTRLPTFVEKAQAFRGATFLVGVDTLVRIAEPKYYGGSVTARDAAISDIGAAGCRFLVFGRVREGRFLTLHDLSLPPALVALSDGLSEQEFRVDLSSTELRNGR